MNQMEMRKELVHSGIRAAALAGIALLAAWPTAVRSDDVPSYASGPPPETIAGTIYAINGRYTLTLEDVRGFEDSITLHDGTIITPSGVTLGSGQGATITGHTAGKTFAADEIDIDPQTISNAQNVLPASDYYALADGVQFPGYAFGYNATAYGLAGYIGPYAQGYYGNNFYGGYYGNGCTRTCPSSGPAALPERFRSHVVPSMRRRGPYRPERAIRQGIAASARSCAEMRHTATPRRRSITRRRSPIRPRKRLRTPRIKR
jgi:hypothetical protein